MEAVPVSSRVNKISEDDAGLTQIVDPDANQSGSDAATCRRPEDDQLNLL